MHRLHLLQERAVLHTHIHFMPINTLLTTIAELSSGWILICKDNHNDKCEAQSGSYQVPVSSLPRQA